MTLSQFWQRHSALIALRSRTAPNLRVAQARHAAQIVVMWTFDKDNPIYIDIFKTKQLKV